MAPDLRKKVDANRAARLAREAATQRQESAQVISHCSERRNMSDNFFQLSDPDAQKPVWADPPKA